MKDGFLSDTWASAVLVSCKAVLGLALRRFGDEQCERTKHPGGGSHIHLQSQGPKGLPEHLRATTSCN